MNPPALDFEDFHVEAVHVDVLADDRNAAEVRQQKPAERLEAFSLDVHVEPLLDLVDVHDRR